MSKFRPQVTFTTDESIREYWNYPSYAKKSIYVVERFKTYRELKKALTEILKKNCDEHVSVCRSKRGEWGEWFEHWKLNSENKPTIIKQGWS